MRARARLRHARALSADGVAELSHGGNPQGFIPLLYAVQAGKYVDPARTKLDSRFAWIDRQLDGNTFLMGDSFTLADAYLFALTGWGKAEWLRSVYHADIDLTRYAHLRAWYERVRARPAVQAVLEADEPRGSRRRRSRSRHVVTLRRRAATQQNPAL